MTKILVTGSAGEIAGNFIRHSIFTRQPYRFASIDNFSGSKLKNKIYNNENHIFYLADVCDSYFLNLIFEIESPEIVIHSTDNIRKPYRNIIATENIIENCNKWKTKKLIYISDSSNNIIETEDDVKKFGEYASSKYMSEVLIHSADKCFDYTAHKFDYNILKIPECFGKREKITKLIPSIINNVLNNKETVLENKGQNIRDLMYYEDVNSAILQCLNNWQQNKTYNISAHQYFSDIEIYQEICNAIGRGHELVKLVPEPNTIINQTSNSDIFRKETGWQPIHKFKNAIKLCVDWYLANQGFLK